MDDNRTTQITALLNQLERTLTDLNYAGVPVAGLNWPAAVQRNRPATYMVILEDVTFQNGRLYYSITETTTGSGGEVE